MNKFIITLILLLFSFSETFSQDIFKLIKENNYEEIKKYEGSLNIYNPDGTTPLMFAVYHSDLKTVKLLIKKGADPKMKSWLSYKDLKNKYLEYLYGSNFVTAAGENKPEILRYFLRKGYFKVGDKEYNFYNRNLQNGWDALQWAAVKENIEIMKYLLKKGADINSTTEADLNQTALLLALDSKKLKSAVFLINSNADVNYRSGKNVSTMDYAFRLKNLEIIKLIYTHNFRFEDNEREKFENKLHDIFGISSFDEI